jgi:ATPase family AAA domain-containing protein 3A/B
MDYKLQRERESLQVADQLARKREEDRQKSELEMERMKAALRARAEEELQAERRRSDEHKARLDRELFEHRAEIERKNMGARAMAEAEGRIKEQRENEELHTRRAKAKAGEDRVTQLESIAATIKGVGDSLSSFILDTPRVSATLVTLTALAAGVYGMREGSRVGAALLKKRLLTPPLVRESSRSLLPSFLSGGAGGAGGSASDTLAGVVLNAAMASRISEVATSVRNTRAHGANFRNLLFYGPPGTGKTLVAKRLARSSGGGGGGEERSWRGAGRRGARQEEGSEEQERAHGKGSSHSATATTNLKKRLCFFIADDVVVVVALCQRRRQSRDAADAAVRWRHRNSAVRLVRAQRDPVC